MKAVVLCGGRGERLRPFTNTMPKALYPINGRPLIDYTLEKINNYDPLFLAGWKGMKLFTYIDEYYDKKNKEFIFYIENGKMGTGGCLKMPEEELMGTFIYTLCDVIYEFNIKDILDFHYEKGGTITIACTKNKNGSPITIDKNDKITSFGFEGEWIDAGVWIIEPELFINKSWCLSDPPFNITSLMHALIHQFDCYAYKTEGYWYNINTKEDAEKVKI